MAEYYDRKLFYDRHLEDHINLRENPYHVHFIKNKVDEGYYLGVYFSEKSNEYSVLVNSLSSLASELRKYNSFFTPQSKVNKRLNFIESILFYG